MVKLWRKRNGRLPAINAILYYTVICGHVLYARNFNPLIVGVLLEERQTIGANIQHPNFQYYNDNWKYILLYMSNDTFIGHFITRVLVVILIVR